MPRTFLSLLALVAGLVLPASGILAHESADGRVSAVDRRIAESPDDARLYLERAEMHRVAGRVEEAAADYARARRLDPELLLVDLAEARLRLDTGSLEQALALVDGYLEARPDDPAALALRAQALVALEAGEEAVLAWHQAVDRARAQGRPSPELYLERAALLAEERGLPAAIASLDEGIEALGPAVTLVLRAIELEVEAGRYASALDRIDAMAARSERKEVWLARRGEVLLASGARREAQHAFRSALDAISSLPPPVRSSPPVEDLRRRVRTGLARTADPDLETAEGPHRLPGR